MSLNIVSNNTYGQCVTINTHGIKFFCEEYLHNKTLFFPSFFDFAKVQETDSQVETAVLTANPEECWKHLKAINCGVKFKPCAEIHPPKDSGLCKSTCDDYVNCNKKVDAEDEDIIVLCNDENYVVDNRGIFSTNNKKCGGLEVDVPSSAFRLTPTLKIAAITFIASFIFPMIQSLNEENY